MMIFIVLPMPGESYNFNYEWIEAINTAKFEGKLLDPDFVHVPGEEEPRKIKPLPWNEIVIEPIDNNNEDPCSK